jgi:hypothetical protein
VIFLPTCSVTSFPRCETKSPHAASLPINHDLPERGFSEENQQVAINRDDLTSLLYSPFVRNSSRFAAITVTFS